MIKLYDGGVYLVNGTDIVEDGRDALCHRLCHHLVCVVFKFP